MLQNRRGETLVEFTLALSVFLVTLLGSFQFGLAVWQYNLVSDLAQEGARWASVRGNRSSTPASAAEVQTFVQSRAIGMAPTVTTYSVDPTKKACTGTATAPSSLYPGSGLCVRVQQSFGSLTRLVPLSTTLSATAQMIVAR